MYTNVSALFGPVCDFAMAPIARQANYWKLPVLTTGAMAAEFGTHKKDIYSYLTRVGPNLNSFSTFLLDLIVNHFHWRKVKLVYQPKGQHYIVDKFCHLITEALHNHFNENDIIHDYYKIMEMDQFYDQMPHELGNFAIILLCVNNGSLRDIMIEAAKLNFNNGEYVFFNANLFDG
ncbi:hypothetical protein A3Q56_07345 [Intoshia linei]|uniref:Receptor ligand binding region domain-containing protein n=1 Tax=Intoshia linei TaxID=1819745 RepID=A0A177AU90_9BILA|nr:hypothetical protein A3Q56_07345 [Intoshia linei]